MGCNVSSGGCNAVDAAMLLLKNSGGQRAERMQKEIDLLWKLTKGNVWDTQTDSTAAYSKTVPSGAVAAEIVTVGGKTTVQDGEFVLAKATAVVSKDAEDETLGTLEIPAALLAFLADKDYGASAGAVSNTIDWAAKTYTRRVKAVDMGSLDYVRRVGYGANPFYTTYPGRPRTDTNNLISAIYSLSEQHYLVGFGDNAPNMSISANAGVSPDPDGRLLIRDDRYVTVSALKASLAGVILYMEIATPEVYDISDYLPDDNMLNTEPGGSLTFVQDGTKLEVPSSVDYLIKLSEVIP